MNEPLTRRTFVIKGSASLLAAGSRALLAQEPAKTGVDANAVRREQALEVTRASQIALSALGDQELAAWGLVDVTKAPFHADSTGRVDATAAIQGAIYFARENKMVLWFPEGVYKVSDTLQCPHGNYDPLTGRWRDRDYPCVLIGSRAGKGRPKLLLAPGSPGFGDAVNRKYVIQFWSWDEGGPPAVQDNVNMSQMLIGIDVVIGERNPGAVAIRFRGAQGCSVQDCSIDAIHGYSGLEGGAGSGGGHYNVSVLGGKVGVDMRQAEPAPTIAGFVLRGQTEHAILYAAQQTLTAVGCHIEFAGTGPAVVVGAKDMQMPRGQVSMVDSRIEFLHDGPNVAFGGGSSLYLNNVFIKGAQELTDWSNGKPVKLTGKDWACIREYAHGRGPLQESDHGMGPFTLTSPIYINGEYHSGDLLDMTAMQPPSDLVSRHIWGEDFPSWDQASMVNVKHAPYHASGDGKTDDLTALQRAIDDHDNVFLPKGNYMVSDTLRLKANTKLIGLHNCFTSIAAMTGGVFSDPDKPRPVLSTADNARAKTIVAFVGISTGMDGHHIAGAYALDWRSGRDSMYRSARIQFETSKNKVPDLNAPLVLISGHGGGRWYNFYQENWHSQGNEYRHLLVLGTTSPLNMYQCNPEHARTPANMEIRGAKNVSIFGLKSEGNQPILRIRDSSNICVFGYGGNATPYQGFSIFELNRVTDFLIANMIDSIRFGGGSVNYYAGVGRSPEGWTMLSEVYPDGRTFATKPLERPVLIREGVPHRLPPI